MWTRFPYKKYLLLIGIVVIFATLLVSWVLIHNNQERQRYTEEQEARITARKELSKIQNDDHVYGPRNAQISLLFYSDANCQYCRDLYPKLKSVVDSYEYGVVALVYRHIPIVHTRIAPDTTEIAAECVAREKGDDGFFSYIDTLYTILPKGIQTKDISFETLAQSASAAGVSAENLRKCVESSYGVEKIKSQYLTGALLEVTTVPTVFVVSELGTYYLASMEASTFQAAVNYVLKKTAE